MFVGQTLLLVLQLYRPFNIIRFWAVSHEATSKFAERVQKWEERIIPKLEKEQQHREFNTRLYSTDLIGAFKGGIGSELTLEQVNLFRKL